MSTPFEGLRPGLDALRAAQRRASAHALRTPLVRLPGLPGEREVWLKLETLQPIGSFKIRGAANAMAVRTSEELAHGVYTASAGNMAQGVAWVARSLGIHCSVVVPDTAPAAKLEAISRLGGEVVRVPFERWWRVLVERSFEGMPGCFVHPVSDEAVISGNAGVGLEILDDLPTLGAVLVPYGGGGLACGVALALRAAGSAAPVFACEVDTAAPLAASFVAATPLAIAHQPSFVDGIGGRAVLAEMWPLASALLTGSLVVSLAQVADAIRALVSRARVVAEGAGAAALAAAHSGVVATALGGGRVPLPDGPLVCVVSGGNLNAAVLARILSGQLP
jgi:threonine dehydratase